MDGSTPAEYDRSVMTDLADDAAPTETVPLTEIERDILVLIDEIRATHRACSPGMIARRLGKAKAWIIKNCDRLKDKGLVDWSAGIGGSLHRTGTSETQGAAVPSGAPRPVRPSDAVATARPAENEGSLVPPDAPEIVIDGKVLHIDRAKIAAALASAPAPRPSSDARQLAKEGRRTARRKAAEKARRPKRERTPAQIAATKRMIDAANAAKAARKAEAEKVDA